MPNACEVGQPECNGIENGPIVMFAHSRFARRRQLPREFWKEQHNLSGNRIFRWFAERRKYAHDLTSADEYQFCGSGLRFITARTNSYKLI